MPENGKVVRSLRFFSRDNGIRAYIGRNDSRDLTHDVGQALAALPLPGRIVFSEGRPSHWERKLRLLGAPGGVVVLFYKTGTWSDTTLSEFVPMCASFRRKLGLNRTGATRWAVARPA